MKKLLRERASVYATGRAWATPFALLLVLAVCGLGRAHAQQAAVTPQAAPVQSPAVTASVKSPDTKYRIGTGDMLDIRVFNRPQFSRDGVRVDSSGMIRMPLIQGEIRAICLTESELAAEIAHRYEEYLREPQVDVFIKEYNSQPVAVIGAVRLPSRFQLTRRVRLLELLTYAGGLADNAGRSVQVVHTEVAASCNAPEENPATSGLDNYMLSETLRGVEVANPFVQPGDVISVPEAEQVFVVGNVVRPAAISLKEPITVTRAIAMAGGVMPDTKKDKVRVVRQKPGTIEKTEIYVDLRAIDKHQAEDVVLVAGDIVDVPVSTGKQLLKSFLGAVVPSVGQLPIRVIP
jgi:polysaccharide export outer membrane protein